MAHSMNRLLRSALSWLLILAPFGCSDSERIAIEEVREWSISIMEQGGDQKAQKAYLLRSNGEIAHIDGFNRRVCRSEPTVGEIASILSVRDDITPIPDHSDGIRWVGPAWLQELRVSVALNVDGERHVWRYADARKTPNWLRSYKAKIVGLVEARCPFVFTPRY